jgi:hypothetical protein
MTEDVMVGDYRRTMPIFESTVDVDAPPADVWAVLVDTERWPLWDSGVVGVDGAVALGAKVTVRVEADPGRAFPVTVVELDPPGAMTWRGGVPLGLFTGTRTYRLSSHGTGTRFVMREEYAGPLSGLVTRSIPDLQPSFDRFAAGLKERVENGAGAA